MHRMRFCIGVRSELRTPRAFRSSGIARSHQIAAAPGQFYDDTALRQWVEVCQHLISWRNSLQANIAALCGCDGRGLSRSAFPSTGRETMNRRHAAQHSRPAHRACCPMPVVRFPRGAVRNSHSLSFSLEKRAALRACHSGPYA